MWEGTLSVEIRADPAHVWSIVSDVERHPKLAGSGEITAIRLHGAVAEGSGWDADITVPGLDEPFVSRSQVVVFDPPREFCWTSEPRLVIEDEPDSRPLVRWWFRLWPIETGTLVTHTFRVLEPPVGAEDLREFFETTNRVDSIEAGMRKTLANLKAAAER